MSIVATGTATTTTLNITFTSDDTTVYLDADSTPTLSVYLDSTLVSMLSSTDITHVSTGVYTTIWTPATSGEYALVWAFTVDTVDYTQAETVVALTQASSSDTESTEPDIGTDNTCIVTGTFIDAGGDHKKGIYVRFSPITVAGAHTTFGYIVDDVTAETDANGSLSMTAVRGVKGLLSITHIGLVREVTIPDEATIDVFALAATGEDLLEVQTPSYYELPRRS